MKLLHVDTGQNWRGGQAQVFNLLKYLPTSVNNHLLTSTGSELADRIKTSQPDVTVHEHPLRGEWDLTAIWKLSSLQSQIDYDLWHAHDSHGLGIIWGASVIGSSPSIIATRRLELPVAENFLSEMKYQCVDQFIAISVPVKDSLVESGMSPESITVIPSGVDVDKIESTSPDYSLIESLGMNPEQPIVGNVGALTEQKDQKTLIKAASRVVADHPKVQFVIAGEGELRGQLERLIQKHELENNFFLAGFQQDIISFIRTFDLFVLTSVFEGLCSTLLQVMASKVPIIATDVGGVSDLIEEERTGLLIAPQAPEITTNKIKTFLNNPDAFNPYVEQAFAKVQSYDFKKLALESTRLYDSILER